METRDDKLNDMEKLMTDSMRDDLRLGEGGQGLDGEHIPICFSDHEIEKDYIYRIRGKKSKSYKVLEFIHSTPVQVFLAILLIIDVFALVIDLVLQAEFPPESIVHRSCSCEYQGPSLDGLTPASVGNSVGLAGAAAEAIGSGSSGTTSTLQEAITDRMVETLEQMQAGLMNAGGATMLQMSAKASEEAELCYEAIEHPPHSVEEAEHALYYISIAILFVFELEFLILIIVLRLLFFRNIAYMIDFIIVTVSLAIEIHYANRSSAEGVAALLIFVRCWRFVRIGHGVYTDVHEYSERKVKRLTVELKAAKQEIARLKSGIVESVTMT